MTVTISDVDERVEFSTLLDSVFDERVNGLIEEADRTGTFPRQIIAALGDAEVFARKWQRGHVPDLHLLFALAERLGRTGSAGISVGVSLHDSAIAILRRFARSDMLVDLTERAIRGDAVVCLGASEAGGGSDLQVVQSTATPVPGGYRVRGAKKFVSLSTVADVVLVVVRAGDAARSVGELALIALDRNDVEVGPAYEKLGAHCLETAPITFDVEVPAEALVARAGTGLAALSWGLAQERLSIAGQVVGACDLAMGITVARLKSREQFGSRLFDHQALRLRFADLQARLDVLRWALQGLAASGQVPSIRAASGLKVTAARLGEEVMSECLHVFAGVGYLVGQAPVEKWWREMKLARVGGGADEVLWELVATGLTPDFDGYARMVSE